MAEEQAPGQQDTGMELGATSEETPEPCETVDAEVTDEGEGEAGGGPLRAPLDPRVLAHVVTRFEGDTVEVADCDVPVYHGRGTLEFRTGFSYTGEFARGRMHGHGRMEWRDSGVVYEGEFTHNEITGKGKFSWPNGSSYEGDVRAGKRHGRGVFYTGTRGALRLGLSIDTSDDGAAQEGVPTPLLFSYEHIGQQVDRDGFGVDADSDNIEAESNARYEGEWVDGLPHGRGILVFDEVRDVRYEGEFMEGRREGSGTMHYANGNVYVGKWKGDLKCGRGVMTWTDATGMTPVERYDGQWANDCQHGFGRHVWLVTSPASCSVGPGHLGSIAPLVLQSAREKNWYEGEFCDGVRCGRGAFYYANGARYEGEWKDNVKEGHGLFFYEDGRVCVGRFQQDRIIDLPSASTASSGSTTSASSALAQGLAATNPAASTTSAVPPPPAATAASSGIILYIQDLFPVDDTTVASKARKAVEHAALRINTEVRTLYRQWIKESRRKDNSKTTETDDSGSVMELSECRHLLSTCGLYISSGQINDLVRQIRRTQRDIALADVASRSAISLPLDMLAIDLPLQHHLQHPIDPNELEVVPCDQQLLYREFVELLSESTAEPVFSDKFRIRDALQALCQTFAETLPDADAVSTTGAARGQKPHNEDPGPDAFFADTLLVYSEFLDAVAIVQFAKHIGLSFLPESSTEQDAALQTPLHALVDSFLQGLQRETKA